MRPRQGSQAQLGLIQRPGQPKCWYRAPPGQCLWSVVQILVSGLCNHSGSGLSPAPLPLAQVFSEYFKELEEESIRDNFVIVYELLDELMDFGFPQTTDSKILQE